MKIVVFGANGATGRLLTGQALAAGHEVTAVTRRPADFPLADERLTVAEADVDDALAVRRVVEGAEAVLSTLGVPFTRKADHRLQRRCQAHCRRHVSLRHQEIGCGQLQRHRATPSR